MARADAGPWESQIHHRRPALRVLPKRHKKLIRLSGELLPRAPRDAAPLKRARPAYCRRRSCGGGPALFAAAVPTPQRRAVRGRRRDEIVRQHALAEPDRRLLAGRMARLYQPLHELPRAEDRGRLPAVKKASREAHDGGRLALEQHGAVAKLDGEAEELAVLEAELLDGVINKDNVGKPTGGRRRLAARGRWGEASNSLSRGVEGTAQVRRKRVAAGRSRERGGV